jgi:hypothetical protein
MRYVVARVITSPAGAVKTARLLITDVPSGTQLGDVLAALEAAGKSADFSEAGVPFGNHEIKADTRGWPWGIHAIDEAPRVTWEKLTTPPSRGEGRRVTLRLTDAEHARYTLAAQRAGQSLQEWMVAAAEAAEVAPASAAEQGRRGARKAAALADAESTS